MTRNLPPPPEFPHLTLVIGGARSGKSHHAERLAGLAGRPRTYIATAQPWDAEMRARIDSHRAERGPGWHTVEAPLDLPAALTAAPPGVILIDCATLWLTNLILGQADAEVAMPGGGGEALANAPEDTGQNQPPSGSPAHSAAKAAAAAALSSQTAALLRALADSPNPVIIVTNELGLSIVPENALARHFRDAQGRLNQALAAQADLVVLVVAGLPLTLKGGPPAAIS